MKKLMTFLVIAVVSILAVACAGENLPSGLFTTSNGFNCIAEQCAVTTHAHTACGVSDCKITVDHSHNGNCTLEGCSGLGATHTHCLYSGCTQTGIHTHKNCGVTGCTQTGKHNHSDHHDSGSHH